MISKVFSSAVIGVQGHLIEVEASHENALPQIHITGLPSTVVKESRDRIRSCLLSLNGTPPSGRVTLHLSPANFPKSGSHYDLAMALSLLGTEGILNPDRLRNIGALGELSLDGRIRGVPGAVAIIECLNQSKEIKTIFVPEENGLEARMVQSKKVRLVSNLVDCIDLVKSESTISYTKLLPIQKGVEERRAYLIDQVLGQTVAKRALEIALAGKHHLLMVGPPGVGKSLIASCAEELLPHILPHEQVELHKIYGIQGVSEPVPTGRPFRCPHHSISHVGLLGGGTGVLSPGEISLAHHGVLFLDELPEFRRDSLEGLRVPLQNGFVHHHRAHFSVCLPASFILLAAMNPCPCGYSASKAKRCACPFPQVERYRRRLSGPFLDRIDLVVWMQEIESKEIGKSGKQIFESIVNVRERRAGGISSLLLSNEDQEWLDTKIGEEGISFRARHKIISVAGTIADLEGENKISRVHLQEAWGFRCSNLFTRFLVS